MNHIWEIDTIAAITAVVNIGRLSRRTSTSLVDHCLWLSARIGMSGISFSPLEDERRALQMVLSRVKMNEEMASEIRTLLAKANEAKTQD
jgi:hypothetical protein